MKNIDIKDIKIGKNKKVKDNKLELVLDLDNTCTFSFLSNQDFLLVDNIKSHYKKKGTKLLRFKYNKKVLYSVLIIRKGLKEFIKYIEALCNFYINTSAIETYGKEIAVVLTYNFDIYFERFKGRNINNKNYDCTKRVDDLNINKTNSIILDDSVNVRQNNKGDNKNVIASKFFFDEECASISENSKNNIKDKKLTEKEIFLK